MDGVLDLHGIEIVADELLRSYLPSLSIVLGPTPNSHKSNIVGEHVASVGHSKAHFFPNAAWCGVFWPRRNITSARGSDQPHLGPRSDHDSESVLELVCDGD